MNTTLFRSAFLAFAALTLSHTANASLLLAGWHDFDGTTGNESADVAAAGFSGLVTKGGQTSINGGGSNDNTYGTLVNPVVPVNDGYARILGSNLTFSLTNSSASAVQLTTLYFDAAIQSGSGTVTVQYQIGAGPLSTLAPSPVTNNTLSGAAGASANYGDFAFNLVGVPLLAIGQTINFVFTASPNARIDNVAITAIPEPASLIALGLVLGSGLFLRQRPRQLAPSLA